MKVGIDSYCFHRFFGEIYPQQQPPERSMALEEFIELAAALGVGGVSLESCSFPSVEPSYLAEVHDPVQAMDVLAPYTYGPGFIR